MRLFIAIPLNDDVREEIEKVVGILSENVEGVRWVRRQNWHVTVKFLGKTPAEKVPGIIDVLKNISVLLPLEMEIRDVGAFSSLGSARVVWVGAYDESRTVHKIYSEIEKGTKKLGFPVEKRGYNPHITIGRARKKPVRLSVEMLESVHCNCRLTVNQVVLLKSELKRSGAEYSVIGSAGSVSRNST